MFAGLDFGTSNCSICLINKDRQQSLIDLEDGEPYLPSALFSRQALEEIGQPDPDLVAKRVMMAKAEQSRRRQAYDQVYEAQKFQAKIFGKSVPEYHPPRLFSDEELTAAERGILRREMAAAAAEGRTKKTLLDAFAASDEILYGNRAINAFLNDPFEGLFAKSPKSFLGAELSREHRLTFLKYCTYIISFIRERAEAAADAPLEQVVIGRPVRFHGLRGEDGDEQALTILREAAFAAGFKDVEFEYEPIAAALDFERTLEKDETVIVLDFGGGTTDCTIMQLGPSYRNTRDRRENILATSGERVGGTDLDAKIAFDAFMPAFGLGSQLNDGLPFPTAYLWGACAINDLPSQLSFHSPATKAKLRSLEIRSCEPHKIERLRKLQEGNLTHRMTRSAELAKIALSENAAVSVPLNYIEDGFDIEVTRKNLLHSWDFFAKRLLVIADEAMKQAQCKPSLVYVTGGTSKAPIVRQYVEQCFPGVAVVYGDSFGSVTQGLAESAFLRFGGTKGAD